MTGYLRTKEHSDEIKKKNKVVSLFEAKTNGFCEEARNWQVCMSEPAWAKVLRYCTLTV